VGRDDQEFEAGWDGHERAQRRRLAALPFPEKLRWLEEADVLVRHLRHAHNPDVGRRFAEDARRDGEAAGDPD
jgi:hypothetical protein